MVNKTPRTTPRTTQTPKREPFTLAKARSGKYRCETRDGAIVIRRLTYKEGSLYPLSTPHPFLSGNWQINGYYTHDPSQPLDLILIRVKP